MDKFDIEVNGYTLHFWRQNNFWNISLFNDGMYYECLEEDFKLITKKEEYKQIKFIFEVFDTEITPLDEVILLRINNILTDQIFEYELENVKEKYTHELNTYKDELEKLKKENESLKNESNRLKNENESLKNESNRLKNENNALITKNKKLKNAPQNRN